MQTLWQYFRISIALVAASVLCGALAISGIDQLEKRKPPGAIALKPIGPMWSDYGFDIRAAGPYRFDLELNPTDSTPLQLCAAPPPIANSECVVPAGRVFIEWQVESENERGHAIAAGKLKSSGSRLYFGSFHWLELGNAGLNTGRHLLRLRLAVEDADKTAADLPWARIRIWRGARDDTEAREAARRTSNWIFATVCALLLALFAIMLEYSVWKRQRAPR